MNITYIIGNGFDVKLGMKTRYIDFYKFYVAVSSESDPQVVKTFKGEINEFIKTETHKEDADIDWRDLEVALGKYTTKVPLKDFDTLYFDIIENLKSCLKSEFEYFDVRYFNQDDFLKYLCNPVTSFFTHDQENDLFQYVRSFSGEDVIDVINFNYTPTVEKLSGYDGKEMPIGKTLSGKAGKLRSVWHIHQSLDDEDILVGVNDKSQIANPEYTKSQDVCELLIKPDTNKVLGKGIDAECASIIANTNLFIIFGSSAGITDSKWWSRICKRLISATPTHARMLFFVYRPKDIRHREVRYGSWSRSDIRRFIQSSGLGENIYDSVSSSIYVSYSQDIFNLPVVDNALSIPKELNHNYATADVKVTIMKSTMRYIVARVDAPNENYGVKTEHEWIRNVFPDYNVVLQAIRNIEVKGVKIPFDRITISNGENRKDLYFDISSYFGRQAIPGRVDIDKEILSKIESGVI